MVEANEEGKQVEQEYGYHSYIQPGEYIANTSTQPKNVNMIFIHLEKSKMEAGGDVP